MKIKKYNSELAIQYAMRWAYDRNPYYYNFDNLGGDCTNFVSQCIFSGSKIMNYTPILGWYYKNSSDRTASWTGVNFLYNFLVNNKGEGPFAQVVNKTDLESGDVIQLGNYSGIFYHTLLVTFVNNNDILVASHTTDSFNRNLSTYKYEKIRFIKIQGVRY